jgi:hypothetical protein
MVKDRTDIGGEEKDVRALAARYRVPYIDLDAERLDRSLIQSFPVEFIHRLAFVPLGDEGGIMRIAVADRPEGQGLRRLQAGHPRGPAQERDGHAGPSGRDRGLRHPGRRSGVRPGG